ncbi:MAG: hypothetical protein IJ460_02005 [Clostridia bacterium]|nr:hypothetical protein [Clostridia bacterium]
MYKRYYSDYDDSGCEEISVLPAVRDEGEITALCIPSENATEKRLFGSLAIDDILLICIFLFLLQEECEDKLMLTVVGFIILSGFIG